MQGRDESLAPRARALVGLAVTLTAEPWAVTPGAMREAAAQGLDGEQVEAAIGVISMFNYFTRVADASGIEFDYQTPLPAFEPDLCRVPVPRPVRPASSSRGPGRRLRPRHPRLLAAWEAWRAYELGADQPISQRDRQFLASIAAQEAADWEGAAALGEITSVSDGDDVLARFARKLSREPWRMEAGDLEALRALGYREEAVLHIISVVAHQNADSRLAIGLGAATG